MDILVNLHTFLSNSWTTSVFTAEAKYRLKDCRNQGKIHVQYITYHKVYFMTSDNVILVRDDLHFRSNVVVPMALQ